MFLTVWSASPTGSAGYTRASSFGDSNRGREHDSVVRRLDMEFQKPGSGPLPKASSTPKMKKRPSIVSSPGEWSLTLDPTIQAIAPSSSQVIKSYLLTIVFV